RQVCALAVAEYGLRVLHAATTIDNVGSKTVLIRTGFVPTGEITTLSSRPGIRYRQELSPTAIT
ncbi:MAG: GNAT family N-acetyltransferase, partial [Nitrososphaerales archaeon]